MDNTRRVRAAWAVGSFGVALVLGLTGLWLPQDQMVLTLAMPFAEVMSSIASALAGILLASFVIPPLNRWGSRASVGLAITGGAVLGCVLLTLVLDRVMTGRFPSADPLLSYVMDVLVSTAQVFGSVLIALWVLGMLTNRSESQMAEGRTSM